ncbi:MAG: aldo/keto reductase [Planctomycetota bacterium]|nr:aldo/keto reductase [Planctomycetota bacterium]
MVHRRLGARGLRVSPVGFGAFKIGRNVGVKYPNDYELPDAQSVQRLLEGVLDLGINLIDTAPAYGLSEERLGRALAPRRGEFVLSTKVGEVFEEGRSTYDYSAAAIRASVKRSLRRLRTDVIDILFIHSDGRDLEILDQTDAVETLLALRESGEARFVGLSGKTIEGARAALPWADVLMVEYHREDRSHEGVIAEAAEAGVGIVVKKPLASGHLPAEEALRFVLANEAVGSAVIGSLNLAHLRDSVAIAARR